MEVNVEPEVQGLVNVNTSLGGAFVHLLDALDSHKLSGSAIVDCSILSISA